MTEVICQTSHCAFEPVIYKPSKDSLKESLYHSWPTEAKKPMLAYFSSMQGPCKSDLLPNELGLESDLANHIINYSIESHNNDCPVSIKSFKEKFIVCVSFNAYNKNESRGKSTLYSLITVCGKKDYIENDLEEKIINCSSEFRELLECYLSSQ